MPSAQQIAEWDRTLREHKSVPVSGGELDKATIIAVVRRIRGLGADSSDKYGAEAMALVEGALG